MDILKDQLEDVSLRRTKDLLNLPEKTIITEYVDMNDKQHSFYDNIKEGIIQQVDKVKMSTASLLAMVTRLRQATACPSILTTENIPSSKIERASDLAKQIIENGDKVVINSDNTGVTAIFENNDGKKDMTGLIDFDSDLLEIPRGYSAVQISAESGGEGLQCKIEFPLLYGGVIV